MCQCQLSLLHDWWIPSWAWHRWCLAMSCWLHPALSSWSWWHFCGQMILGSIWIPHQFAVLWHFMRIQAFSNYFIVGWTYVGDIGYLKVAFLAFRCQKNILKKWASTIYHPYVWYLFSFQLFRPFTSKGRVRIWLANFPSLKRHLKAFQL